LIGAVACGLGVLLAASEIAFQIVKWAGAAYLAWLGVKLLRSDAALTLPSERPRDARPDGLALGMRSFVVALTNPKALLFMSAFLPQ
ncbi:LysE family transporter, partial [Paenibacillus polymyxa]|nr:LysE family transporter [Paenibacillus polymyxa]